MADEMSTKRVELLRRVDQDIDMARPGAVPADEIVPVPCITGPTTAAASAVTLNVGVADIRITFK